MNPYIWNPRVDIWDTFFQLAASPFNPYWFGDVIRFILEYEEED